MLALLIETSTERAIVAVMKGHDLLHQIELPFGFNNSKFLLPAAEDLLKQAGLSMQELSMIVTGIGPGSYTGIRVGAIVAKSLAYALQIPLVGVSSLEGFIPEKPGQFAAMIDAKIGGAYLLTGRKAVDGVHYSSSPMVCPIEKLNEHLHDVDIIVTPESKALRQKLQDSFPTAAWEWEERSPCAVQLMLCAMRKFQQGDVSRDGHLDLLYLRKTQAEIEKESNE